MVVLVCDVRAGEFFGQELEGISCDLKPFRVHGSVSYFENDAEKFCFYKTISIFMKLLASLFIKTKEWVK
jgi:hypothetical protein